MFHNLSFTYQNYRRTRTTVCEYWLHYFCGHLVAIALLVELYHMVPFVLIVSRKHPWLAQSGEGAVHSFTCMSHSSSTRSRPARERARSESQDCQPSMGPNALVGEGTYSRWSAALVVRGSRECVAHEPTVLGPYTVPNLCSLGRITPWRLGWDCWMSETCK